MNSFTISQLSRYSGIKAHTIRIWEKRYQALKPFRSEGNTRYYNGDQLRRLLNIVSLMKKDHRISELSKLSDEKLQKLITALYLKKDEQGLEESLVSQLIGAGLNYDEENFEKVFSHCLLKYGLKEAYKKVLYPMLERIGIMWCDNTIPPAQEHFLTNLLRQKMLTAIDYLPSPVSGKAPWILFLPEDEFHEIGLLMAHYMVRSAGQPSVYLGANVPLTSLKQTIHSIRPGSLLFFMVHYDQAEEINQYFRELKKLFNKKIYVAGNPELLGTIRTAQDFKWLRSIEEMENLLQPELSN